VLKVRGKLEAQQVNAIATSPPPLTGLKPERLHRGRNGRSLADGARGGRTAATRPTTRRWPTSGGWRAGRGIVSSSWGPAMPTCSSTDFDFNRVTQTSKRYDPEDGSRSKPDAGGIAPRPTTSRAR